MGGGPGNAEPWGQRARTKEVGPGLILGDGVAWKGWAGAEAEVKGGLASWAQKRVGEADRLQQLLTHSDPGDKPGYLSAKFLSFTSLLLSPGLLVGLGLELIMARTGL